MIICTIGYKGLSDIVSGEHGGEFDIRASTLRDVLIRCICLLADSLSICTLLNTEFHTSYSHLQHSSNSLFFPISTCYSHLQHLPVQCNRLFILQNKLSNTLAWAIINIIHDCPNRKSYYCGLRGQIKGTAHTFTLCTTGSVLYSQY